MSFTDYNWTPILLPFVVGIIRYSKQDTAFKILYLFVAYGVFNELAFRIWNILFQAKNTIPLSNLYLMISFILLLLFYQRILKGMLSSWLFLLIIISFELACFLNFVFFQTIWDYPSILQTISKLIFVTFSIVYFYKVMTEAKITKLWNEPLVWVNLAVLVYYSANLFFSLLFNLILEYSREFSKITMVYFSLFNALFYMFLAIGFWKAGKQKEPVLKDV